MVNKLFRNIALLPLITLCWCFRLTIIRDETPEMITEHFSRALNSQITSPPQYIPYFQCETLLLFQLLCNLFLNHDALQGL